MNWVIIKYSGLLNANDYLFSLQHNGKMILNTVLRRLGLSCKYPEINTLIRVINHRTYRILKQGIVSPRCHVPDHIVKPPYAVTGMKSKAGIIKG